MEGRTEKICEIYDPDKLRSVLLKEKGGEVTCAKCCAVSHDEADLCSPIKTQDAKLFCEIEV
jgi:hypothetical protein